MDLAGQTWQYWATTIAPGAFLVAISLIVRGLVEAHAARAAEDRSAGANALAAAVTLENYALACAEATSNHQTAEEYDGDVGKFLASVREPPALSGLGPVRPEKAAVASRLAAFSQEIVHAERRVAFWWDMTGEIDITRNAAKFAIARVALESIALAAALRYWFSLPERKLQLGKRDLSAYYHEVASAAPSEDSA